MKNKLIGAGLLGVGLLLSLFFWVPLAPSGETLFGASRFSPGGGSERSPGLWQLNGTVISPTNPAYSVSTTVSTASSTFTTALNVPYITDGQVYYSDRGTARGDSGFTFNSSTDALILGGPVTSTALNTRTLKVQDGTVFQTLVQVNNTSTNASALANISIRNGTLGGTEAMDLYTLGTGYSGITGWSDAGVIIANSGLSGGLRLSSQSAPINMEVGGTGNSNVKLAVQTSGIAVTGSVTSSLDVIAGGITSSTRYYANIGSNSAPAYTFNGDLDTGMYQTANNNILFSAGGTANLAIISNQVRPVSNNTTDLGSALIGWKDFYASGTTIILSGLGAPGSTADITCWGSNGLLTHQATNCTVSSAWFKENIKSMDSKTLMEKVRKLRAVEYDMKDTKKHEEGFVAEEMAMIDPSLVVFESTEDQERIAFIKSLYPEVVMEKDGKILLPKTVDYARVSVLLTGAIQDLDARLEAVEKKTSVIDQFISWLKLATST